MFAVELTRAQLLMPLPAHLSPSGSTPYASLSGALLVLEPLDLAHFSDLLLLAQDPRIWEHFPESRTDCEQHLEHLLEALQLRDAGVHLPFAVRLRDTGEIAGYTRLHSWDRQHRRAETGSWLHPNYWRSGVNAESKLLLLRHCFEELDLVRVQFKTAPDNHRSRTALEKLGATYEGLLRNDRILPDGRSRDTVVYSIIQEEWNTVRQGLLTRLQKYQTAHTDSAHAANNAATYPTYQRVSSQSRVRTSNRFSKYQIRPIFSQKNTTTADHATPDNPHQ